MKILSKYDNPATDTTNKMADTLGVFMAAYSNKVTDQHITSSSPGSNWRKFMNPFAIEIESLLDRVYNQLDVNINRDNFLTNVYMINIPSEITEIDSIQIYESSILGELTQSDNIFDFLTGAPITYTFTTPIPINIFNIHSAQYTGRPAPDYNDSYIINSVTVNNVDAEYTVTYNTVSKLYEVMLLVSTNTDDVVKISYRTLDTFYYDNSNKILYIRDLYGDNENIYVSAHDNYYPCSPGTDDGYSPVVSRYWNTLDSIGLLCDTERLEGETDELFRERIRDAYIYLPGVHQTGIRNVLARKANIIKHYTWNNDRIEYPLSNIHEDSLRIDYRPIDHYSYVCSGVSIPAGVITDSIRLFRNGIFKHQYDDYIIKDRAIYLTIPITSTENIVIDYIVNNGYNYVMFKRIVPEIEINGYRNTFTLPVEHIIGKTQVYHNSLRLSPGSDFNEAPGSITLKRTPLLHDNVTIIYHTELTGAKYKFLRHLCTNTADGFNRLFTIPDDYDFISVYVNGCYHELNKDYIMTNRTTISLYLAPDDNSRVEACLYHTNAAGALGGEFEQLSISYDPDGTIRWNIGSIQPDTKFRELKMQLQYLGVSDRTFDDVWLSANIKSDTYYAHNIEYFNTLHYDITEYSELTKQRTNYIQSLKPARDGYISEDTINPGILYGYIPKYPAFELESSYINVDRQSTSIIRTDDHLEYSFKVRNIGDKIADGTVATIYAPMRYTLSNENGGHFTLKCVTPRGLQHDIRYILSSRWNIDTQDSINVFPIHDKYYHPRLLLNEDGTANTQLETFAQYINHVAPVLWGYGKWDEASWDTYDNVYSDIYDKETGTLPTTHDFIDSKHTIRGNFANIPHLYDPDMSSYPQSTLKDPGKPDNPSNDIWRRMDFRSGIGFDDDLVLDVHDDEAVVNAQCNTEYRYPVYINKGVFYLNDKYSYQFAGLHTISIHHIYNPLIANNRYMLPHNIHDMHVVIMDNACIARKTCFFDSNHNNTHQYTDTVYGNGLNTKLKCTFTDIDVKTILFSNGNTIVTIPEYTVTDNVITIPDYMPGVEQLDTNEYIIDTNTYYIVQYTLNNSYYIDSNDIIWFDKAYDWIMIRYNKEDVEEHYTGIDVNPLYTPYCSKFIYGDIFDPKAEDLSVWCSPGYVKAGSGEPVYAICQVTDKHGTPVIGKTITWIASDGQTYTGGTDKFGRNTWKLTLTTPGATVNITATVDSLSSFCSITTY